MGFSSCGKESSFLSSNKNGINICPSMRGEIFFGEMTGSMKTWNDQAMTHFRDIACGPGERGKLGWS